jgi:endonuclease/exonuclease/phosphatase (EEP) superfamily protein YafD
MRQRIATWVRYAHVAVWIAAVASVTMLCAADLLPQSLATRSQPYLTLAAASFVVQTLQFHIGLACLAFLAIAGLRRSWRLAVVAGMGTLMGLGPALFASLSPNDAPAPAGSSMRVMSVNVHLYNRNAASLLDTVKRAAPDVIVIQEYSPAMDEGIRDALADDYAYQIRKPVAHNGDGWAVYSRRPLLAPIDTALRLDRSKRQARFAVRMGDTEVVIYALHLTSPQSIEKIGRNRAEVADLVELLAAERKPVILAGDFNFTQSTANAAALRARGMRDAHALTGDGRGSTWRFRKLPLMNRLPGFQIDHIFVGPQLTCTSARVLDIAGSDHRPVLADIALAAKEAPEQPVASVE